MSKKFKTSFILIILFAGIVMVSCDEGKLNIFTIDDDIQMGRDITAEILANPLEFPVLDRAQYPEAYAHIERIRDGILATSDLRFRDRFDWDVYIIDKDILNAFALPGGNTFYYTGLIKFLDCEASLAGVMAHEFAHADRRHSSNRLSKIYGYQVVIAMLLGNNPTLAAQIAADLALNLGALAFSRKDEYEADEYAVKYIYPSQWDSRGVAFFFEEMETAKDSPLMVYFRTHPHPDDRIEMIYKHHSNLGGKVGERFVERYQEFKNSLP